MITQLAKSVWKAMSQQDREKTITVFGGAPSDNTPDLERLDPQVLANFRFAVSVTLPRDLASGWVRVSALIANYQSYQLR